MILTITPNPAVDVTYHLDRFTHGSVHRASQVGRRGGGKGVNVSSVLSLMGVSTLAVAPVGGATGQELITAVTDRGVPVLPHWWPHPTRQTLAVVEPDGTTTNISEPGPAPSPDEWAAVVQTASEQSTSARAAVISGSLPGPLGDSELGALVAAVGQHTRVAVDAAGTALLPAAEAGADLLAPNLQEAAQCFPGGDPLHNARQLVDRGAGAVLLSAGAQGLLYISGDTVLHQPPVPGISGNTTGAGDAALALFTHHWAQPEPDVARALRAAAAAGASAVCEPVAGHLSPQRYREMLHALPASTPGGSVCRTSTFARCGTGPTPRAPLSPGL